MVLSDKQEKELLEGTGLGDAGRDIDMASKKFDKKNVFKSLF